VPVPATRTDRVARSRGSLGLPRHDLEVSDVESMTIFVSDSLQARLDTFRERGAGRTATSVTFDAIEYFRAELPQLVDSARARLVWAVPEEAEVRYLGAGPVHIRLRPGAAGANLLERLSTELDLCWRTWIPPVLNAYLPGRREPENMPWLVCLEASHHEHDDERRRALRSRER
jgi:hypothetical protein